MPKLTAWQDELVAQIVEAYQNGGRVILQTPSRRGGLLEVQREVFKRVGVPGLTSTDVNQEAGRFCPKCGSDWRADEISRESLEKDYYGHVFPCVRAGTHFPDTPCECPPRFFSRLIGIIQRGGGDRVNVWMCPDCGQRWDRDTREPVE